MCAYVIITSGVRVCVGAAEALEEVAAAQNDGQFQLSLKHCDDDVCACFLCCLPRRAATSVTASVCMCVRTHKVSVFVHTNPHACLLCARARCCAVFET